MFGCRGSSRARGRIKVVRDVDIAALVPIRQWAEGVDMADGAQRSLIKGRVSAGLSDTNIRGRAVAFNPEGDVDAVALGLWVEHHGVPLGLELPLDLLVVVAEAGAEGGVLRGDAEGARMRLSAAHWDAGGGLAGLRLVGVNSGGLRMERRRRRGLVGDLRGLGGLGGVSGNWDCVGFGSFDGVGRGYDGRE